DKSKTSESIFGPYPEPRTDNTSKQSLHSKPRIQYEQQTQNQHIISPLPKLDFSHFDGTNPRSWILKCNSYFKIIPNVPDHQKVLLASMHFEGKAAQWYQSFSSKCEDICWADFIELISARFEALKESKIIGEFNKLRHVGSYVDYVEKFEELRACMICMNHGYTEEYFIASFVSGLSEELQSFINMFEPQTLQQTIELGKKQLLTLEAITKKLKNPTKFPQNSYQAPKRNENYNPVTSKLNNSFKNPVKLLTASEMAARREKGLCYNCDEQFTYGHRCKHRLNFMTMTEEEEVNYLQSTQHTEEVEEMDKIEEIQMSLNAIAGEDGLTTMRVFGDIKGHKLHILIDSGSTLSFIQASTAKSLGLPLTSVKPLMVKIANGQRMISSHVVEGFQWFMQGQCFTYSLRVLDNEGCDMILGGDWLKSCTPIELDYEKMSFTVTLKGKR
ncbi:Unknown protein, partial [Striga hermonthica]